jgi:phosphatidylglycerophosphate synthase
VTVAVLFTAGVDPTGPAVALAGQLGAAGVGRVWALARPDRATSLRAAGLVVLETTDSSDDLRVTARIAAEADEPVVLCAGDLVANDSVLDGIASGPADRSAVLVAGDGRRMPSRPGVRFERDQLIEVVPGRGAPFLGVLRIARDDLPALATAATATAGRPDLRPNDDLADLILPALADAGIGFAASRVRLLYAERVADAAGFPAARAAAAAVDEDAALLRLSVKEKDDFFTTYAVSSWSPLLTKAAARLGLSPTVVTLISLAFAVLATGLYAVGSRPALVLGGVLLYLGFVLDCVDGQLARYTRRFSRFGGWLDTMADRAKEYLVYAGLAAGAVRTGLDGAWAFAVAAIALQTVRHMTDTWYGALHDEAAARRARSRVGADPTAGRSLGDRLGRMSNRVQGHAGTAAYWLKRIVVFPIGERWALIAVTAALFNGRAALLAVLVLASLAAAYTLVLRAVRSRAMRVPLLAATDLAAVRDDGPLARRLLAAVGVPRAPLAFAAVAALAAAGLLAVADGTGWWLAGAALAAALAGLPARAAHDGALDWLVPAALRAVEFLLAIGVAAAFGVPLPALFALLFALAMHFYDLTARMEKRTTAPRVRGWALGWDGRTAALLAGAALGWAFAGTLVLAGYVLVVFGVGAVMTWAVGARPPAGRAADVSPVAGSVQ